MQVLTESEKIPLRDTVMMPALIIFIKTIKIAPMTKSHANAQWNYKKDAIRLYNAAKIGK